MADDRLQQAVDIVARHVIARAVAGRPLPLGQLFCKELGEETWKVVSTRVRELTQFPDQAQYEAAYDYLAGRAEGADS